MQSFDSNDKSMSKIVSVDNFEQIIDELKKPDVEYVKVFMHNGELSIEKEVSHSEALLRAVSADIGNLTDLAEDMVDKLQNRE